MAYEVLFSKRAIKDRDLLKSAGLSEKARALCKILSEYLFQNPPPHEKLVSNLKGSHSRRINVQHRLVYEVDEDKKSGVHSSHVVSLRMNGQKFRIN